MNHSTFASRLKKLRIEKKLTQSQLAEKLNETSKLHYTMSSISAWESRGVIPPLCKLEEIATYFSTSMSFLTGTASPPETMEKVTDFHPLGVEELERLAGECVYVLTDPLLQAGQYAIVSSIYNGLLFEDGAVLKFTNLKYDCYRTANPLRHHINYVPEITISLSEAKKQASVWLTVIMASPRERALNGWYYYENTTDSFVSERDPLVKFRALDYEKTYTTSQDPFLFSEF